MRPMTDASKKATWNRFYMMLALMHVSNFELLACYAFSSSVSYSNSMLSKSTSYNRGNVGVTVFSIKTSCKQTRTKDFHNIIILHYSAFLFLQILATSTTTSFLRIKSTGRRKTTRTASSREWTEKRRSSPTPTTSPETATRTLMERTLPYGVAMTTWGWVDTPKSSKLLCKLDLGVQNITRLLCFSVSLCLRSNLFKFFLYVLLDHS